MIVGKWWVSLKYNLINATNKDTDYIKKSKLYNIFTYADDLPKDEVMRINNYVDEHIPVEITDYKIIMCNKNKVGCLLVTKKDDGVILDEIYLEEEYRNKGIIKNLLSILIEEAKDKNYDYLVATVHPENIASNKAAFS